MSDLSSILIERFDLKSDVCEALTSDELFVDSLRMLLSFINSDMKVKYLESVRSM